MSLRVLHLSTIDFGGAAIATMRLCQAQREQGVEACMLVTRRSRDEDWIIGSDTKYGHRIAQLRDRWDRWRFCFTRSQSFEMWAPNRLSNPRLIKQINAFKPDLVHLHWVSAGMISPEDLRTIHYPIVWTMHDMWPSTGGYHYLDESEHFWCREQNQSVSGTEAKTRIMWKQALQAVSPHMISPSRWLKGIAELSEVLHGLEISLIANGVDTTVFKPGDKATLREELGLPNDKPMLLFAAEQAETDPRKGFTLLKAALKDVSTTSTAFELVVMGSTERGIGEVYGLKCHRLGKITGEINLAKVFASVDGFVIPSLQDNLPNTVLEAMSCGCPVVGFEVGGIPDMIEHGKNGYLANKADPVSLSHAINQLLETTAMQSMSNEARYTVKKSFNIKRQALHYIDLYKTMI